MRKSPRSWLARIPASPRSTRDECGDAGAGGPRSHQVLLGQAGPGAAGAARARARRGPGVGASRRGESHGPGGRKRGGQDGRRAPRGRPRSYAAKVQMVFQDPFASLNPVHTIRHHLIRPLEIHHMAGGKPDAAVAELLRRVALKPPENFTGKFPHELSGGQRQRVAIARALAVRPRVLIADEPVSMLDVSIRLGVLNLLAALRDEERLAILYVTHDIASARYLADTIVVMYAGQLVESAPSTDLTDSPAHPYTQLLLSAAPDPDRVTPPHLQGRGAPPSLSAPPSGCRFHPRCPFVMDICKREVPPSISVSPGHVAACWLHVNGADRGGSENGVLATPSAAMENEIKR